MQSSCLCDLINKSRDLKYKSNISLSQNFNTEFEMVRFTVNFLAYKNSRYFCCFYTMMHSLYACFQFRYNSTFRGIHTHDLKKFILIYTIGNTESNNWYKLNPEQYRARSIIQIIHSARLRIEWKRWLFKFSRLSVSPLNYRHYIRQMMNESIAISCNFQLDLCLYTVTRVIHTSVFVYFSCSCLRFEPPKIHAQMFRLYIRIFFY